MLVFFKKCKTSEIFKDEFLKDALVEILYFATIIFVIICHYEFGITLTIYTIILQLHYNY